MSILILSEHDNKKLKEVTLHAITAAKKFNTDIDVIVAGYQCDPVVSALEKFAIRNVLIFDNKVYEHLLPENIAPLMASIAKNYTHILATASTFSKNILPRLAALLDVGMVSDVTEIISDTTFVRPMFAGNVLATVETQDPIKVLTVRNTAFPAYTEQGSAKSEKKEEVIPNTLSQFEKQSLTVSERPELTSARIVLSGGRGLKSAENFKLLESVADKLGAAIGASRAAVDAGYAPNDYQVGQTGKVVAPDLYIAVGISGAIQHMAGMKDSKVIVAINNDPDAPIMQMADYTLVGDLFKILPELLEELDK